MNYKLVEQSNNRVIYEIEKNGNKFYMVIPNAVNVNIVLNLFSNDVLQNVKNIPNISDKVIVVPELGEQYINYLKAPRPSYEQASGYFSGMINMAQGILINNRRQVASKVYFNNNQDFSGFINWYVGAINKPDSFVIGNVFPVNNEAKINNVQFSQPVMGVGSDIPLNSSVGYGQKEQLNELENNIGMVRTKKREPGFVSYVLLGVMVAIMSLVFLYMLL